VYPGAGCSVYPRVYHATGPRGHFGCQNISLDGNFLQLADVLSKSPKTPPRKISLYALDTLSSSFLATPLLKVK